MDGKIEVLFAESPDDLASVRALLAEYTQWLLSLKTDSVMAPPLRGIHEEMESLPGIYSHPMGFLVLAKLNGKAAGCVALKQRNHETAEIKRLFVRQEMRGHNIGRLMIQRLIEEARLLGHKRIVLDSHV